MLVNADIKGLEVVVAAQLSGDLVLGQEIVNKENIHDNNRIAFNLGEGKPGILVAKIFKFRLIYGGSAYSYAHDPLFMGVSTTVDFWQEVIDRYYKKYYGIANWHKRIDYEAKRDGRLTIPSGRYYPFNYEETKWGLKWPDTKVKNYPVQGFGADLVMLARLEANRRLRQFSGKYCLISTIHDSIVVDTTEDMCYTIGKILRDSVEAVPRLCKEIWGYNFVLPMTAKIEIGMNKRDMKELVID